MDKEMVKALKADGEKLRQLTGEDHGPFFIDDETPQPVPPLQQITDGPYLFGPRS